MNPSMCSHLETHWFISLPWAYVSIITDIGGQERLIVWIKITLWHDGWGSCCSAGIIVTSGMRVTEPSTICNVLFAAVHATMCWCLVCRPPIQILVFPQLTRTFVRKCSQDTYVVTCCGNGVIIPASNCLNSVHAFVTLRACPPARLFAPSKFRTRNLYSLLKWKQNEEISIYKIYRLVAMVQWYNYHNPEHYPSSGLSFKTQLYNFVHTSQETHYVSATSPTG
jgi:hypothetical protein